MRISARILVSVGGTLGLLGSLWAWRAGPGCAACQSASGILGPVNLAAIGVGAYAALLAAAFLAPPRFATRGLCLAAGAHLLLLALLLILRIPCPPCIATGAAVMLSATALGITRALSVNALLRWLATGTIAAALAIVPLMRIESARRERVALAAAIKISAHEPTPAAGSVKLIILIRPGCKHCEHFQAHTLADLRRTRGPEVTVEFRPAPEGVPTPTTVILGIHRFAMQGDRSIADLSAIVDVAAGRAAGRIPPGIKEMYTP